MAVLSATVFTAWTPIFGIVIVFALVPIVAAGIAARRAAKESPGNAFEQVPDHLAGPDRDVRLEDGMVSDRKRADAG